MLSRVEFSTLQLSYCYVECVAKDGSHSVVCGYTRDKLSINLIASLAKGSILCNDNAPIVVYPRPYEGLCGCSGTLSVGRPLRKLALFSQCKRSFVLYFCGASILRA